MMRLLSFVILYMLSTLVNVEALLARAWGRGKGFPPAPGAGKQRLYIQEAGAWHLYAIFLLSAFPGRPQMSVARSVSGYSCPGRAGDREWREWRRVGDRRATGARGRRVPGRCLRGRQGRHRR